MKADLGSFQKWKFDLEKCYVQVNRQKRTTLENKALYKEILAKKNLQSHFERIVNLIGEGITNTACLFLWCPFL